VACVTGPALLRVLNVAAPQPILSKMMIPDLERVTAAGYLDGLADLSTDEVRAMRADCQALENTASFVRRFVQGRLDLVISALAQQSGAEIPTLAEVVVGPDTLTRSTGGDRRLPRPTPPFEPDPSSMAWVAQLDDILSPTDLGDLPALASDDLTAMFEQLTAYEQQVSAERRGLHQIIDVLQAEIVRRYRSGETSVDALLSSQVELPTEPTTIA